MMLWHLYIDLIVHDIQKAHRALRAHGFHVNGRKGTRKAWTRIAGYGTVKVVIHENLMQVNSIDVRETVERVNVAMEGMQLALTLKGLAQPSRLSKLRKDWDRVIWLANSMARQGVKKSRSDMISSEQQENWARRPSHIQYQELLDTLEKVGYKC